MKRLFLLGITLATLAGCGSIEESEPKPRLETLSTPGTAYGSTLIGTRKRLSFVMRNSDAGFAKVKPLTGVVPTLTGTGLTLSQNTCPGTLNEGDNCYLSVDYEPTTAGALTGELRVTSNAETVVLTFSGTAVTALDPVAGALAFVPVADGNFGAVAVGQTRSLTFVVRNIGNAADTLTVSGPSQAEWTVTNDCPVNPSTLAVGATCNIAVAFKPSAGGVSVPAPLVISDPYGADYGALSLTLQGTGS